MDEALVKQVKLNQNQIKAFYVDGFAQRQIDHFVLLTGAHNLANDLKVVDIGGGCGFFAIGLHKAIGCPVRVIDSDAQSIAACAGYKLEGVESELGDALNPRISGDEGVVCFNLILHHLIGDNEAETTLLQANALKTWQGHSQYVFVNEYIYDSYLGDMSGRLIYEVTKSPLLSAIGRIVSRFLPSLRVNTFGVGVRFRSHDEWLRLFEAWGFDVVGKVRSEPDKGSVFLRALLLVRESRKDSFLLKTKN